MMCRLKERATFCLACSSFKVGKMTTSSPSFQFTGVATECFAVNCRESMALSICTISNTYCCSQFHSRQPLILMAPTHMNTVAWNLKTTFVTFTSRPLDVQEAFQANLKEFEVWYCNLRSLDVCHLPLESYGQLLLDIGWRASSACQVRSQSKL